MASGKTRHLLTEIDTLRRYGNKKIAVFKPRTDTRSGMNYIKSRKGDEDAAEEINVANPAQDMLPILRARESDAGCRFQVIAFDEVQFFPRDSGFFQLIRYLIEDGYDILASGLAFDFRGEPFGSTPDLALLAEDRCMWMTSYCTRCGAKAPYPQRILDGVPAHTTVRRLWWAETRRTSRAARTISFFPVARSHLPVAMDCSRPCLRALQASRSFSAVSATCHREASMDLPLHSKRRSDDTSSRRGCCNHARP